MIASWLSLWFFVAPALANDCATAVRTDEVEAALQEAESRYSALDLKGFVAATDNAGKMLPCLTEAVPRPLAAAFHRFQGLRSFVDRQNSKSVQAFAAARSVEAAYTFPASFVPEGNPVLANYTAVDPATGTFDTLGDPKDGYLQFDGKRGSKRSTSFPTIAQLFDGQGAVTQTAYLWPGDPMLAYELAPATVAPVPGPKPDPGGVVKPAKKSPKVGLLVGAGSALVAGGLLYGLAGLSKRGYLQEKDPDRLDGLRARTNGLVIGAGVAGVGAVGLGVAGAFAARW